MYAILNFNSGWATTAEIDRISKAIVALVCGSSLAQIQATELAASSSFNLVKSFRKPGNVNHYWIRDTDTICHAPCDTLKAQSKYVRFALAGSHMQADLSPNIGFSPMVSGQAYTSTMTFSNGNPVNIHIHCTRRCIVVGIHQETQVRPVVTVISEFSYDAMPYMDDDTGTFIPAALSGLFGYMPMTTGSAGETSNPWRLPTIASNHNNANGSPATAVTNTLWRIGNCNVVNTPAVSTIGDTRHDINLLDVENAIPIGVFYSTTSTHVVGSITDKSDIWFTNGLGYPATGDNRQIPPDVVVEIDGKEYVTFEKIIVPFV